MLLSSNSDAAGKCMRFALVSFVAVALSVSLSALDLEARPDSGFSDQGDFRIAQGDSGSMSERFRKYQDGGLDKEDPGARHQRPGQQGDEPDSDRRARFKEYLQQMPPEKRQQFKNRLQQMSPSERQEMMRKLRQKGHNGGPGDRPDVAGGDGGAPDEMAGEGGPGRRMQGRRQA
ncbi:MAG: hypothetical protein K8F91_09025, partial [Candidatus Obscuribacterales bacterium]|nr:hypothetical protein [Candidatus Obscuribacterales bacterium]